MSHYESRSEGYDSNHSLDPNDEQEISLKPLVHIIWNYRRVIAASVSVFFILCTLGSLFVYISQPIERKASLEFRLLFKGADGGKYPNDILFNPTEIISTAVLTDVYTANDLKRYCSFEEFKNGLFIIQSGSDL